MLFRSAAIKAQDAEHGQRVLRRHLKGVDAYFRMFFSELQQVTAAPRVRRKPAASGAAKPAANTLPGS